MGQATISLLVAGDRVGARIRYTHEAGDVQRGSIKVDGQHAETVRRFLKQPGSFYQPVSTKRRSFGVFPGNWAWLLTRCLILANKLPFVDIEFTPPRVADPKPTPDPGKTAPY